MCSNVFLCVCIVHGDSCITPAQVPHLRLMIQTQKRKNKDETQCTRPTPRLSRKGKKGDQNAQPPKNGQNRRATPAPHLLLLTLALIHRKNAHRMPQRLGAGPRTNIHHAALRRPAPALPRLAARTRRVRPRPHLVPHEPIRHVRPRR